MNGYVVSITISINFELALALRSYVLVAARKAVALCSIYKSRMKIPSSATDDRRRSCLRVIGVSVGKSANSDARWSASTRNADRLDSSANLGDSHASLLMVVEEK